MKGAGGQPLQIWEYQAPAVLNQAAPVQNTWYTLLDTTSNCRILEVVVNVEDANETLEVKITIDGETIQADDLAATHSTDYYAYIYNSGVTRLDYVKLIAYATEMPAAKNAFMIEGRSIKIEIRKTTATGAGNLTGICTYAVKTRG